MRGLKKSNHDRSVGLTMIETLTLVGYAAQGSHFDRISIFEDSYLPYLYLGMRS